MAPCSDPSGSGCPPCETGIRSPPLVMTPGTMLLLVHLSRWAGLPAARDLFGQSLSRRHVRVKDEVAVRESEQRGLVQGTREMETLKEIEPVTGHPVCKLLCLDSFSDGVESETVREAGPGSPDS